MSRRRKHHTVEQILEAKRIAAKRYYHRHKVKNPITSADTLSPGAGEALLRAIKQTTDEGEPD